MNWQKYTLDDWLAQFGAWCNTNLHHKTGHTPYLDRGGVFDMVGKRNTPKHPLCEITDSEAYAINQLLGKARKRLPFEVGLLIDYAVNRKSFRLIAKEQKIAIGTLFAHIQCSKYFLLGLNPSFLLATDT